MSFFESISLLPDDPIMNLSVMFGADSRTEKVNLGIGSYKDAQGKSYILPSVKKAEAMIFSQNLNKEYLPIEGDHEFIKETLRLIFGKDSKVLTSGEVFAVQTVGGTAALRIGAEFLVQETSKSVYMSNPTWANHKVVFKRGGMLIHSYDYYDEATHRFNFEGFCKSIQTITPGSVILLHACCHNPTGVDPNFEQWKELSKLILKQKIIPFFDFAYQGIGDTIDLDAQAIRYFAEQGHEMLVAYSHSKNFGLYGERCGVIAAVAHHKEAVRKVGSQLKQITRGIYSTSPLHGERIVKAILTSEELRKEWLEELAGIRERIKEMRKALVTGLMSKGSYHDWSFLEYQKGMFSFSGLNPDQTNRLIKEYGIYMLSNGRINVAGLNEKNIDYVVDAMQTVITS